MSASNARKQGKEPAVATYTEPPAPAVETAPVAPEQATVAIVEEAAPAEATAPTVDAEQTTTLDAAAPEPKYATVYGGPMVDPDSQVVYTGVPQTGTMTGWLSCQIEHNRIYVAKQE